MVVGVNKFQIEEEPPKGLLKIDHTVGNTQKKKLVELKANRDNQAVKEALQELGRVAVSDENLMPAIIECVRTYCTLGEICDVLRKIFGEYQASITV